MKRFPFSLRVIGGSFLLAGAVCAQINVTTAGQEVRIGSDGSVKARAGHGVAAASSNEASVNVGSIAEGANIEGVTVINNRVSIDGKEVPADVTRYKSPRTGKVYLIKRQGGAVSVSESGGIK